MYKVSGDDQTAKRALYTKEQLQVYDENEKAPRKEAMRRYIPEKIIKVVTRNRRKYLEVKWKGYDSTTLTLYSQLKRDRPDLVKEFENKNKRVRKKKV